MTHHFLMSDVDEYGFIRTDQENTLKAAYFEILTKRSLRWNKVFSNGRIEAGRRLQRFIRKGLFTFHLLFILHLVDYTIVRFVTHYPLLPFVYILGVPLNLRLGVWMKVSGTQREYEQNSKLYIDLLKTQYQKEIVEIVKIDIPRTFPENIYFEVHKNELFNILVAFAQQNSAVGYCQGLNYIAGLILIVTKNEPSTFWLLKHLVENVAPEYHTKTM